MPEPEFIRKDVFDIHVKSLRDRDDAVFRLVRVEHHAPPTSLRRRSSPAAYQTSYYWALR